MIFMQMSSVNSRIDKIKVASAAAAFSVRMSLIFVVCSYVMRKVHFVNGGIRTMFTDEMF